MRQFVLLLAAAVLVTGCQSPEDALGRRSSAVEVQYPIAVPEAWEIAEFTIAMEGGVIAGREGDEGPLFASFAGDSMGVGSYIAVWCEPAARGTTVACASTRRWALGLTMLSEETFHRRFREAMERRHQGRLLPAGR